MSHIVTIETQIRDSVALAAACRRQGLSEPVLETARLFSGEETGYCVRLPGWRYPVVCNVQSGSLKFDNFGGRWGSQVHLDRLIQSYAVEKTRLEAIRQGHALTEQSLPDGSIKLTLHLAETI